MSWSASNPERYGRAAGISGVLAAVVFTCLSDHLPEGQTILAPDEGGRDGAAW
jgi:hypothetical protein